MAKKEKPHLRDHVSEEFHVTELQAKDAPTENVEWTAQNMQANSDPIRDEGSGRPIILRHFEFELPKDMPKSAIPSKAQLLEGHRKRLEAFLWKDALEPIMPFKIIMSKSRRKFRIFATCQPRKGNLLPYNAETQTLNQILNKSPKP